MALIAITGTNRGIGLELARQYLNHGDKVIGCNRHPADLHDVDGARERYLEFAFDLTDAKSIERMCSEIKVERLDVLILNAAENLQLNQKIDNFDANLWLREFQANVLGNYGLVKHFKQYLTLAANPVIAAISSNSASVTNVIQGGNYPYRTCKAALNSMIRLIASDVLKEKIIAVSIAPGRTKTRMGGEDAPNTVENSANCIRTIIGSLTIDMTGAFLSREGVRLPY